MNTWGGAQGETSRNVRKSGGCREREGIHMGRRSIGTFRTGGGAKKSPARTVGLDQSGRKDAGGNRGDESAYAKGKKDKMNRNL